MQVLDISQNTIVCVNLMDEARKKGIVVDTEKLSKLLNVPVIGLSARSGEGIVELKETMHEASKRMTKKREKDTFINYENIDSEEYVKISSQIASQVVTFTKEDYDKKDRKLDKIFTSKLIGIPIMLLLLMIIFWITIVGANYPSSILFDFFTFIGDKLLIWFENIGAPEWVSRFINIWCIQSFNMGCCCYASTNGNIFPFIYAS